MILLIDPSGGLIKPLLLLFLWLPISLWAQETTCSASNNQSAKAALISADSMIEALRADSNLLDKAQDTLVREAYSHGFALKKLDLTDEKLFALIRCDLKIQTVIQSVIEDDRKVRSGILKPVRPEELPIILASQEHVPSPPPAAQQSSLETPAAEPPAAEKPSTETPKQAYVRSFSPTSERNFVKNIIFDQRDIWTSPKDLRFSDLRWLIPTGGITAGLLVTDRDTSRELSRGSHVSLSSKIANGGVGFGVGTAGAIYLYGKAQNDQHATETGLLSAESVVNTLAFVQALKFSTGRLRPTEGDGSGHFFRGSDSFPSDHSAVAWSIASIIAHEYPGWLTKTLAYGGASAVSLSRVAGQQHFLSDVFVGGTVGYLVGRQVYHYHHDESLGGERWGTFSRLDDETPRTVGSIYVPLDSWVYPALDRLAGMGIIHNQFAGLRPWTRIAILQMLSDASDASPDLEDTNPVAEQLLSSLETEFSDLDDSVSGFANQSISLDSIYTRTMFIHGQPLNDSDHFGQTIINDFGRPYQQGFNEIAGFTSHAENGRFSFFLRGEYQHSRSASAYSLSVRNTIAQMDQNPVQPAIAVPQTDQVRLLDSYVSMAVAGHEISIGKQSLWWGPGAGGPMLMSDNAEPIYMIRINRVIPLEIPLFSKIFGPIRYDNFFGRVAGHQFPPRPFFYGQKISLKPTENFEFGFSRTAVFAGEGLTPLTAHTFFHSLTSVTSGTGSGFDIRNSPGARHGSFDFTYRLPYLRNWVTIYSDSIVHDDVSPIDAPRRAGWNPGIYLSHLPKLPKLDLRLEAIYTDPPITNSNGGKFIYWETFYHDAHTNKGNLLGSWVGREGKGFQAWTTYWLSPVSTIQVGYRNAKIAKDFVPDGATQNDFSLNARFRLRKDVELNAFLQYEKWDVPALDPRRISDFTTSVQLTFWPEKLKHR